MKVSFVKFTNKNNFLFTVTPVIMIGKASGPWSIAFCWFCFSIDIEF